jgi:glycosyltransferase involved in cell wall biosynthesis
VLATAQRRGAESFAFELHAALAQRGHDSSVLALVPAATGARSLPVDVAATKRFSLTGSRVLRRRAAAVDVVVAHGSSTLLACATAMPGLGVPFVYANIGDPRYWAGSLPRRLRVGLLLRRAAAVSAICGPAKEALVEHFRLNPSKVTVIPNGRSAQRFAPADPSSREAARHALALDPAHPVVAAVGALSPEKRVDVAIRAVASLADVRLVLAGDGPDRAGLEQLAEQLAPRRVRFLGSVDDPVPVYSAADALLLTSDSEGVPGVLIEAGLAGLPVVATDVGWVREVVREGTTGRLVPAGDSAAVATALADVLEHRDTFGGAARRHCVSGFDLACVVDRWEALLAQTIRS